MSLKLSTIGLIGFAAVLLSIGCAPSTPPIPATIPFSGKITLGGKPLAWAVVGFMPVEGAEPPPFNISGVTDSDGNYELTTRANGQEQPGAVPGTYKIVVVRMPGGGRPLPQTAVPQQYADPQTTTLEVTIPEEGGTQDFDLQSS